MSEFKAGDKVYYVGVKEFKIPAGDYEIVAAGHTSYALRIPAETGATVQEIYVPRDAVKKPQGTPGTNPKDALGIKKAQLNLVPPASVIYQALAMEDGARKYGPYNWRQNKVIASIYVAAAMRHLMAWQDGEENAGDSGKPHLGHALACLGILVDALETGNLVDDRPVKGAASQLIAKFEKK